MSESTTDINVSVIHKRWGFFESESQVASDLNLSIQEIQELYNKTGWALQQQEGNLSDF